MRPYYPQYVQYGTSENPFHDNDVVDHACEALRTVGTEQPFFLFVGPLGPHDPYIPPQRFLDLYDPDEIELPESFSDDMNDKPALYRRTRDRYAQLTEAEHRESVRRYLAFCSYEDWQFGRLLDILEKRGLLDNTVVLYVSDHGESLGEGGLYLHGAPYFMAPSEQIRVPMVMWLPKDWSRTFGFDAANLAREPAGGVTHEHLYSTVLGMLGVQSTTRRPRWDLTDNRSSAAQ